MLIKAITQDGYIRAYAIDATDIAEKSRQIHHTTPVVTAAMGRLLTAGCMMGSMLKDNKSALTLRVNGTGPIGAMLVSANAAAHVKGYMQNPYVDLPLNPQGKLDVAGAVGKGSTLFVIQDLGLKEPYVGQIAMRSGEIAEDIAAYYAYSEQVPTVCALGVLVDTDYTVKAAGGYLVQLMPGASEEAVAKLEENVRDIAPISTLIDRGFTPKQVLDMVLQGISYRVLEEDSGAGYVCDCSRERTSRALISIGKQELQELIDEDEGAELSCQFCNKKYQFTTENLKDLLQFATDYGNI